MAAVSARPEVARVLAFTLDGNSGTCGFAVFEGGARVRRWAYVPTGAAPIRLDAGAPLPTEPAGEVHGETRIDAAAQALLGDRTLSAFAVRHPGPVFPCALQRR